MALTLLKQINKQNRTNLLKKNPFFHIAWLQWSQMEACHDIFKWQIHSNGICFWLSLGVFYNSGNKWSIDFFSLEWQNCKLITNCKVHFYCVFYYKSCISYTFPTFFWPFPVKNFFFLDSKVYFYCLKVCSIWKYVFALLALVFYFSFFICWLCYDISAFLFGFCYFLWFTLVFHFIFGILQLFDNFCCFHLSLLH